MTNASVSTSLAMLLLLLASPADAWWGKLEKLSGPGEFRGKLFEFRVACFGDKTLNSEQIKLAELAFDAAERTTAVDSPEWKTAADAWESLATKVSPARGRPVVVITKNDQGQLDYRRQAKETRAQVGQERAINMATSSAGVFWSLCSTDKERRFAIDTSVNVWEADGSPHYAGGKKIHLNTLMTSVSWRVLADTSWDVVEVSAGGGAYWFSSEGFPSKSGVVLQPGRVTFRAPSEWSGKPLADIRRWLAVPVYGVGITLFPAGFEPADFAGVEGRGVRIPAELLLTQYFFVNVEPFLRGVFK